MRELKIILPILGIAGVALFSPNHGLGETAMPIVNRVMTSSKVVALTFDADMTYAMQQRLQRGMVTSWYNNAVIDVLQTENVPATLFLTGLWIETYPEITRNLSINPLFELANHSYSHPGFTRHCYRLPFLPNRLDAEEITKTDALLKRYAPSYKKYFRFPGFCYDPADVSVIEKLGYTIIDGNVRGGDGFTRHTRRITRNVVAHTTPGSIIVLHLHGGPDAPMTAQALSQIIHDLKAKGYQFVKVSELLTWGTPSTK